MSVPAGGKARVVAIDRLPAKAWAARFVCETCWNGRNTLVVSAVKPIYVESDAPGPLFPVWMDADAWGDFDDHVPDAYEVVAAYESEGWTEDFFLLMRMHRYRRLRSIPDMSDFPTYTLVRIPYVQGIGNRVIRDVPDQISVGDWFEVQFVDVYWTRREAVEYLTFAQDRR